VFLWTRHGVTKFGHFSAFQFNDVVAIQTSDYFKIIPLPLTKITKLLCNNLSSSNFEHNNKLWRIFYIIYTMRRIVKIFGLTLWNNSEYWTPKSPQCLASHSLHSLTVQRAGGLGLVAPVCYSNRNQNIY